MKTTLSESQQALLFFFFFFHFVVLSHHINVVIDRVSTLSVTNSIEQHCKPRECTSSITEFPGEISVVTPFGETYTSATATCVIHVR
jgi:hypothetical protein